MQPQHVVIVGGTSGSGRVLVRRFSDNGAVVSLLGRHPSPEVEENRRGLKFYPADLRDTRGIPDIIRKIVADQGKISQLVFYQRFRGEGDSWEGELQVSLTATKQIIETCADLFDGAGGNSIVAVSSLASSLIHDEQPVSYHMAKAGLNQMIRYYAVTLGSRGIRVNCVSPATVVKDESRKFYAEQDDLRRLYEKIIPLHRMGTAEDIADVIEFLCSEKASYITGQELVVDGGLSLVGQSSLSRHIQNFDTLKVTR
jgi:NAD(P)-dependent dehydrogenase (short-subunit alcohol dehydrogenase family)